MDPLINTLIILILPLALALFAYRKNLMTPWASVTAYAMAELIGFCTNIWWVIAFFMFPVVAFLATKWRFEEKVALGVQEGKKGERSVLNLLGVGVIPCAAALVYALTGGIHSGLAIAFLSALAVSTADTVASEIGPLSKKTYMITTLKEIEPGPNGGVSVLGFASSFAGAVLFAFLGYDFIFQDYSLDISSLKFLIIAFAGMFGNLMDSILGAILENPGYIGKYTNNCSTSLMGAIFGYALWMLI